MKYIHIAGTNGKGSVAEYLSCILLSAWNRCGCYTSPHLVSHTERIRVGNEYISEEELGALLTEVKERGLVANETLFSAYTAAALLWFARKDAAYAVIETGLGGRLDPTNKIAPSLTILTSIDYDHTDMLGSDLKSIAMEKCGIIKNGVPVISPIQRSEVEKVIRETCEDLNAPLHFTAPVKVENRALWGQVFNFEGDDYLIGSIGLIQPEDAALAIKAAKILDIDPGSIKTGIMYTSLRGRTQYIPGETGYGHRRRAQSGVYSHVERHAGPVFSKQRESTAFRLHEGQGLPIHDRYVERHFFKNGDHKGGPGAGRAGRNFACAF